jgi:hypothetical protein
MVSSPPRLTMSCYENLEHAGNYVRSKRSYRSTSECIANGKVNVWMRQSGLIGHKKTSLAALGDTLGAFHYRCAQDVHPVWSSPRIDLFRLHSKETSTNLGESPG